jgi:hypothetical protein
MGSLWVQGRFILTKISELKQGTGVKLYTTLEEIRALRPIWEGVQWYPGADYEFFTLIVQSRSETVLPCVLVLYKNHVPISLLAGRIEKAKMPVRFGYASIMEIPVRQLVFIAGGFMGERSEAIWESLLTFAERLMIEQKIDLAIFEYLKVPSRELESAKRAFSFVRFYQAKEISKHWLLSLPTSWDGFMKSRSSKHRYWLKRLPRVLDREFPRQWNIVRYVSPDSMGKFGDAAEEVARSTYQRRLAVGFRRGEESLQRLALDARRGRLRGYVLFIREKPKAFWYCFVYKRTLYLASTGYDPAYRSYELGTILLMKILEDHCGTDVREVDFGEGDADYKRRFGSGYFVEGSAYLFAGSLRGLCLHTLHRTTIFIRGFGRNILDRLQITRRIKTRWRRKLEGMQSSYAIEPRKE